MTEELTSPFLYAAKAFQKLIPNNHVALIVVGHTSIVASGVSTSKLVPWGGGGDSCSADISTRSETSVNVFIKETKNVIQ